MTTDPLERIAVALEKIADSLETGPLQEISNTLADLTVQPGNATGRHCDQPALAVWVEGFITKE